MEIRVKRTGEYGDDKLVHSDTFLGEEISDELYHWKYIDKKKVNGKWRYYYHRTPSMAIDDFKWGYELGSKKDPNTGSPLNKKNIDPNVYAKLAKSYKDYYDTINTPFYSGRETSEVKRDLKETKKQIDNYQRQHDAARSVAGKLGQIAGRTVISVQDKVDDGKKWIDEKLKKR